MIPKLSQVPTLCRVIGLTFLLPSTCALAEDDAGTSLASGMRAVPISKRPPNYPRSMLSKRAEGWVNLSYVIAPDGSVSDVVVESIVGPKAFAQAAVDGVKNWKFEPAQWQGKPIEQCSNEVNVRFLISGDRRGATPTHARRIKAITELIEEGKYAQAEQELSALYAENLNNYEFGFYHMKRAHLAHAQGRFEDEAYYLGNAALGQKIMGTRADRNVLQMLFVAQVRANQPVSALETFEKLSRYRDTVENWEELEGIHATLVALRDSTRPILTKAVIPGDDSGTVATWHHRLLKRSVEFADLKGNLGTFEFRCERKHFRDDVSTDRNWSVPEHWGKCSIYVFGEPGASFSLYELSPTGEAAGAGT